MVCSGEPAGKGETEHGKDAELRKLELGIGEPVRDWWDKRQAVPAALDASDHHEASGDGAAGSRVRA